MRRLTVFNLMSLDGFVAGPGGDISWHMVDEEFQELAVAASNSGNTLVFGRVTYELMASYWPTEAGRRDDPLVAAGMEASEKIVFSRSLKEASWHNTRLVREDLIGEIRRLKRGEGKDLTILGSASLVAQLAAAGEIDEYQILLNPLALGSGKTMFAGLPATLHLELLESRAFRNGNLLLRYRPARSGA